MCILLIQKCEGPWLAKATGPSQNPIIGDSKGTPSTLKRKPAFCSQLC
jgi:hypothetical protein